MRLWDLREHAQIYASARPKIVIDGRRNRVFESRVGAPNHVVDINGAAHPLVCEEDVHAFDELQPVFDDMTYAFARVALLTGGNAPPARRLDTPHSLRRTVAISGLKTRELAAAQANVPLFRAAVERLDFVFSELGFMPTAIRSSFTRSACSGAVQRLGTPAFRFALNAPRR